MSEELTDRQCRKAMGEKLSRVSKDCAYLQKDREHGIGYRFVSGSAVTLKVSGALQQHRLAVIGTKQKVTEQGARATVHVSLEVCDLDTGFTVTLEGVASGIDTGDKGTSKAVTVAAKYAWLIALCISTGDDDASVVTARESARAFVLYTLPGCATLDEAAAAYVRHAEEWIPLPMPEKDKHGTRFGKHCRETYKADPATIKAAVASAKERLNDDD